MNLVSEEIDQYCASHSTVPSQLCEELAQNTRANVPMHRMLTGPLEGSFLGLMIHVLGAKRVLELGTFTGYSALAMAERLPADGKVITLDTNPETNRIAQSYWDRSPHGKKIQSILGPALQSMEQFEESSFDLVFIDADKGNYIHYLKKALPLLRTRGVILVDNVLWSGRVLQSHPTDPDTAAIQQFNEFVTGNSQLESVLLPLRDGIYVIRKSGRG